MGGCQSSQAIPAPLRRKGELIEAESRPYLLADQKTPQYWVDPNELAADEREKKSHADAKKSVISKGNGEEAGAKAVVGVVENFPSKKEDFDDKKLVKEMPTPNIDVNSTILDKVDKDERIAEGSSSTSSEQKKVMKPALPTKSGKQCPPYAVIYDESKQDIKLIHWATYEKKYLPGFLAERNNFLKSVTQPDFQATNVSMESGQSREDNKPMTDSLPTIESSKLDRMDKDERIIEEISSTSAEKEEIMKPALPIKTRKPCPPYAVIYDESKHDIKLIHWATYEKKFLPGILAERETFFKSVKQPEFQTAPTANAMESEGLKKDTEHKTVAVPVINSSKLDKTTEGGSSISTEQKEKIPELLKDKIAEGGSSISMEQKEEIPELTLPKKQCPPYAVIYDDCKQNIKLIHWATYEKKYLPGFLGEREKFLKSVKQPEFQTHITTIVPIAPEGSEEDTKLMTDALPAINSSKSDKVDEGGLNEEETYRVEVPSAGSYTTVYDPENQYVKLILWDEYQAQYQQQDLSQWEKQKKPKCPVKTLMESRIAIKKDNEQTKNKNGHAVIYDESSQSVELIPWEHYESEFLPSFLAIRKERELSRFHVHQKLRQKKLMEPKKMEKAMKSSVAMYNEEKQEVCLQDFSMYRPTYKQDYAMIYNPSKQAVDLIFWSEYLNKYEAGFRSQWYKSTSQPASSSKGPLSSSVAESFLDKKNSALELTSVYDPKTEGVKLMDWNEYLKTNKSPKQDWSTEYDEKSQSVKLVFWKQYQSKSVTQVDSPLQENPSEPMSDFTTIYDPSTQGIKLVTWDEYLKEHKPPKQDWSAEYDEKTQTIRLNFWKQYQPVQNADASDAANPALTKTLPVQNLTTIYDPLTEGIKLISWEDYLKENIPVKQDWTTEYDEQSQSVRLVFWKPYQEAKKSTPETALSFLDKKQSALELTSVYDPETEGVKLMDWNEYLKVNESPKQDWTTEYDEKTQSVKLIFWKQYQSKPVTRVHSPSQEKPCEPLSDFTTIYDPLMQGIKLVTWDEYLKEHKPPKQDWSAEYDEKTQTVRLNFWKQYQPVQNGDASNAAKPASTKPLPAWNHTTIYDPMTEGIKLVSWEDYLKENTPAKQDWTTEYNEQSQSIKLVFWKPYQEAKKSTPESAHSAKMPKQESSSLPALSSQASVADVTTVYDPTTEEIKLVTWDDYVRENKLPKQDWSTEYDEKTQSVKLVFWKQFQPTDEAQMNPELLTVDSPSIQGIQQGSEFTTIYDPITEGVLLITWDEYLKKNRPPKQDWSAEYDEKTQSVKLVFWKEPHSDIKRSQAKPATKVTPAMTTTYNETTQSVDLIPYDEYLRSNKVPKQDFVAVYDEVNKSVKLIFWKDYQESLKNAQPIQTSNKAPTKIVSQEGGFAAMYNGAEQSIELIDWEIYKTDHLPGIICEREKKQFVDLSDDVCAVADRISV